MASDAKRKLVDFLEEKAFQPVMRAKPENYPESKRAKLKDVQRSTQSEIERFRGYDSAEDVATNFKRDLDSDPAKKIHGELHDLDLPALNDIRRDFEQLARDLGIEK